VVAVVASSVALALFTPDMVSGSEHEHLPLAGAGGVAVDGCRLARTS
jgi:hypothetical protein